MSVDHWWKRGVVYQVYPLSFQDTDGDGRGDLAGVRARLDYLVWLGIDAIWISPIYPSPMADNGYDVADYCDVAPSFGSLATFDALVADAHAKGIRVILDYVPNHTSDQHAWFRASRSSRDDPQRDWYIWHDPAPDGGPPNNWVSEFGGSAWTFDPTTAQYYYHAFLPAQPDLNWRNTDVRAAMYDVLRFWLDRGVDGFRIDVLWHLAKDPLLRDDPPNPTWTPGDPSSRSVLHVYSSDRPDILEIVGELRRVVDAYPGRILIGELYLPMERLVAYYGVAGSGVHLPFNFHLIQARWRARDIAGIVAEYERLVPPTEWPNWVLGNHDQPRIASRVGAAQARVAAMLLLTLRGTPTLYYGDELGMPDLPIPPERSRDGWAANEPGIAVGRDPQRTPMQWDASAYAGFTSAEPWLPVQPAFETMNVEALSRDPRSILALYRRLIALRRAHPALSVGTKRLLEAGEEVLAYERSSGGRLFVVALHFGGSPSAVRLDRIRGTIALSTHLDRDGEPVDGRVALRADEGVIVEVSAPE